MARPDGRIEQGQPLRGAISARAWNRAQDAADLVFGAHAATSGVGPSYGWGPFTSVLATTDEPGLDMVMGYAYSIKGVAIEPSGSTIGGIDNSATSSFMSSPVVKTTTPYRGGSTFSYCVALEPIANGSVGRVAIAGVVAATVNVSNANHQFANFGNYGNGDSPLLQSAYIGGTQIVWKPSTPSGGLCLVRIGAVANQIRSGTVASLTGPGSWDKGTYKNVMLDDASGLTSSVVGVINKLRSVYIYYDARAYVLQQSSGEFELIAIDGQQ